MPPLSIENVDTNNCGALVSVPKGSTIDVSIKGGKHVNTDNVYIERDDTQINQIYSQLGLDRRIDANQLVELIKKVQETPPQERVTVIEKSEFISKFGGAIASVTSFAANLATLATTPQIAMLIQRLGL